MSPRSSDTPLTWTADDSERLWSSWFSLVLIPGNREDADWWEALVAQVKRMPAKDRDRLAKDQELATLHTRFARAKNATAMRRAIRAIRRWVTKNPAWGLR